ncbi:hypothetical protein [Thermoactinomyces mirandus]|uniref:Uncharacterized protein n=1 Tax=Thermoactinomyces mirandus TaxID=2756294 RepID=A0A7W1XQF6_9BACL|nr:hypothetical protein [Thermoactinomyces mirandus]MBA4601349.1 hypothetical protein [Thermoactinomyces mirandus]
MFKSIPAPYTPYKEIRKLKPGEILIYQADKKILTKKHYHQNISFSPLPFRKFFFETVKTTMKSDVKVACIARLVED